MTKLFLVLLVYGFLSAPVNAADKKAFNEDGGVPEAGLRMVIDEAKKAANIGREVSLNEIADLTIHREAQREMGFKAP